MKSIKILLQYLRPYKWLAAQNMAYNILSAFFALFTFTLIVPFLQILFSRIGESSPSGVVYAFNEVYQRVGGLVLRFTDS